MIVLVIGGSGSGKSEFAETICMELPAEEKCYIATMQAFDDESRARKMCIRDSRLCRSGAGAFCRKRVPDDTDETGSRALPYGF